MQTPQPNPIPDYTVAAVVYDDAGDAAAAALWQLVRHLQKNGRRIAGLLNPVDQQGRHDHSVLVSVADPRRFPIFQALGSGAGGCKLDAGALAAAGAVIREAVADGADLVVINKFGHAEIRNRGLLSEHLAAASGGIPLITAVHRKYLPDWRQFSGSLGAELPADADALAAWFRQPAGK